MNKFGLTDEQYSWIKKIFSIYLPEAEIFVFGSRAGSQYKQYSDLDLAIRSAAPIQQKTWLELHEHFSESFLPIKVDLIEFKNIDPDFQKAIQADLQPF